MAKPWPEVKILYVGLLIEQGFTNTQIAKECGVRRSTIANIAKRYFNGNPNYRRYQTKHKHLRLPVMAYFVEHTAEETQAKFKITSSEFKSICTVSYRMPELAHLRKDTRTKRLWDTKDTVFMLQRAGLIRREVIGQALGRGKDRVIKERLQKLGVNSKTLQGMTLSTYRRNFGQEPSFALETRAGPSGGFTKSHQLVGCFKIVPWVTLKEELRSKKIRVPKIFSDYIKAMSRFQEWIFEGKDVVRAMKKIIKEDVKSN